MADLLETDFTRTVHKTSYPAISPTRPELSQAGRTVLVTGGGTGIGKSIAEHFLLASAATVIIVGRRVDVLQAAVAELTEAARNAKVPGKIIYRQGDLSNKSSIDKLWNEFVAQSILIDVLILNAAKFTKPKSLLELGSDEIWSQVEMNLYSPMVLTERFLRQNENKQKFLVNITSAVIHGQHHPFIAPRAAYILSKTGGTLFAQLLADQIPADQVQIISLHPGMIFGAGFEDAGMTKDMLPFDEVDLPGAYAVWAASKEASFAHGRILWASWDVEELSNGDVRRRFDEDDDYLRISVVGIKLTKQAPAYKG